MGKSLKDVSRKNAKKREHLRSMPYETTPAQRLMREEMEAGVHKAGSALAVVTPPDRDLDSSIVSGGKPLKVKAVLDDVLGPVSEDRAVTELAYDIIREHGEGLVLNLQQWPIVQRMVEAAIRRGSAT